MSFQDILSKPMSDIKKPPPYPVGTYLCVIDGPGTFGKVGQDQTDVITYQAKMLQAKDDVDPAALAAYQQETGASVFGKSARVQFFLTEAAAYRAREWLVNVLGVAEILSLGEALPQAAGKQLYITLKHVPIVNKQTGEPSIISDVAGMAKV